MTFTCIAAWTLVLLLLPVIVLLWATESRHTRIQRYRRMGWSWQQIADRYRCSASTARRWAIAWLIYSGEHVLPFVDTWQPAQRLVTVTGLELWRNCLPPGQQRLPWAWDVRLNQIPEDWHQVAVMFRSTNGIKDGDLQLKFWGLLKGIMLLLSDRKLKASFTVPGNCGLKYDCLNIDSERFKY